MNKQEIFTKVKNHLLAQNKRSTGVDDITEIEVCKYLGEGGLMCAVGCLISDELYSPEIEGLAISNLPTIIINELGKENVPLLKDLQHLHDRVNVEQWETELRKLATIHNLEF
jgi:hypothetical protein